MAEGLSTDEALGRLAATLEEIIKDEEVKLPKCRQLLQYSLGVFAVLRVKFHLTLLAGHKRGPYCLAYGIVSITSTLVLLLHAVGSEEDARPDVFVVLVLVATFAHARIASFEISSL